MISKFMCAVVTVGAMLALSAAASAEAPRWIDALFPPDLPEYTPRDEAIWLDQNWSADSRFWFHHASQGTSTLPVPYEWFVALEQPRLWLFGKPPLLRDSDYLARFGFIPSPKSLDLDEASLEAYGYFPEGEETYAAGAYSYDEAKFAGNEHELPVGFARLRKERWNEDGEKEQLKDPVTGEDLEFDQIGLTCAASHTGHLEYKGTSVRIDGAPAMVDLKKFRKALAVALAYTSLISTRFDRFADRVLGQNHSSEEANVLEKRLEALLERIKKLKKITDRVSGDDVDEGFARLDALNRIGNAVFFNNLMEWDPHEEEWVEAVRGVKGNLVPLTAPVNFPQIWGTSWFQWVQYDASIMQPMVRNAGEALGVKAMINLIKPGPRLYDTLADFEEIFSMEQLLAGKNPWQSSPPRFMGLRAPEWPEDVLGEIDIHKKDRGRKLYAEICQACHLPPVSDKDWSKLDPNRKTFWDPMFWTDPKKANERYLEFIKFTQDSKPEFANLVGAKYLGTDPTQAAVIKDRRVRTPLYLGIDPGTLCEREPQGAVAEASFAEALAVVVEKATNKWYVETGKSQAERDRMDGYRPNCLQAEMIYKARPLDGIWATAPFLHNGSVPNLYQLLSPVKDRTEIFCLGDRNFDTEKVGYVLKKEEDCGKGETRIDTSLDGNSNKGHEFKDGELGRGVVGRYLDEGEREDLVEYLKSL